MFGLSVTLIISSFFLFIFLSILFWSFKNGISPMPTSPFVKKKLLAIPCSFSQGKVYELGSGWGTLAFAFAKKYPEREVEAFETSLVPYLFSRFRLYCFPQKNLHFHRIDFFSGPLQDAVLVICYLYPKAMEKLKDKFDRELPLECIVLSHTFAVPGLPPIEQIVLGDLYRTKIYVYKW
jgi:hypothetical protein